MDHSNEKSTNQNMRYIARFMALLLAMSVGTYIVFCRGTAKQKPVAEDSPNAPALEARTSIGDAPESCEGLALEIRQFDIFMTTSKSGPSPADMNRLDAMRARYDRHCKP
ncbi:MAG: hypothetical protein NXI24_13220 [bacterium]|nr:hypothetical protein [bacterium]